MRVTNDTQPLPAAMRSLTIDAADACRHSSASWPTAPPQSRGWTFARSTRNVGRRARWSVTNDATGTRVTARRPVADVHGLAIAAGELTVTLPPELARKLSVTIQQEDGALMAQADLDQLIARTDGRRRRAQRLGSAHRDRQPATGSVVTREPISVSESFIAHRHRR